MQAAPGLTLRCSVNERLLMSTNPAGLPEVRLELPRYRSLYAADEQDAKTLANLLDEPQVEFYVDSDPSKNYWVYSPGQATEVADTVTLNGTQWLIVPGKNVLPKSIHKIYIESPHQGRLMPSVEIGKCVGSL